MKTSILTALLGGVLSALMVGLGYAGPIASRGELQSLLGGQGTLEAFEQFNVEPNVADDIGCSVLTNASSCAGQTNLVVPGIAIRFGPETQPGTGQWNGAGFFGGASKDIVSPVRTGQPLEIDFLQPVQAFGLDLRAFDCDSCLGLAVIQVWDADDRGVIGTIPGKELIPGAAPLFVGWEDSGGIGRVRLIQTNRDYSPVIDNLEFGNFQANGVAEPSALSLIVIALAGLLFGRLAQRTRP